MRKTLAAAAATICVYGIHLQAAMAHPQDRHTIRWATASWYGPGLYGNHMACGGVLTTGTYGVAHKTLPCGTIVRICYQRRCANVPVLDRGPYVAGREFDLTGALAVLLGFRGVGQITWQITR